MSKYCNLLRHGISVFMHGELAPCCKFNAYVDPKFTFRDYPVFKMEMEKMVEEMAAGTHDKRCSNCWFDESMGLASLREMSNNNQWGHLISTENFSPQHVELRLGNYCNLKCLMCWPGASSSFQTEYLENQEKFNAIGVSYPIFDSNQQWWETDEFLNFFDEILPTITLLHFTGGEPFMVPALPKILQKIPNPEKIILLFVTNMTTIKQKTLDLLSNFKMINLSMSLEGVEAMNDYVRYPSKWQEIESNIDMISNHFSKTGTKFSININHTFQHTSIYALPSLYEWAGKKRLSIFFSTVSGKSSLRVDSVPEQDIRKFSEWFQSVINSKKDKRLFCPFENRQDFIKNTLDFYRFDRNSYEEFRKYVRTLDDIRGTNYDDVFSPGKV